MSVLHFVTLPQLKNTLVAVGHRFKKLEYRLDNLSQPDDDIKILNALTDFGFSSPLSDIDGDVIVDVDGNILVI